MFRGCFFVCVRHLFVCSCHLKQGVICVCRQAGTWVYILYSTVYWGCAVLCTDTVQYCTVLRLDHVTWLYTLILWVESTILYVDVYCTCVLVQGVCSCVSHWCAPVYMLCYDSMLVQVVESPDLPNIQILWVTSTILYVDLYCTCVLV